MQMHLPINKQTKPKICGTPCQTHNVSYAMKKCHLIESLQRFRYIELVFSCIQLLYIKMPIINKESMWHYESKRKISTDITAPYTFLYTCFKEPVSFCSWLITNRSDTVSKYRKERKIRILKQTTKKKQNSQNRYSDAKFTAGFNLFLSFIHFILHTHQSANTFCCFYRRCIDV